MGTVTMPTEVIMNGGAPWGFRLSGGGTQALTVSRLTPGGKAALDGVVQGDHVIAINGQQVAGLQLGELMELIKNTGQTLNLTTISESEVQAQEAADNEQCDIKANLVEEHVECIEPEAALQAEQEPMPTVEVTEEELVNKNKQPVPLTLLVDNLETLSWLVLAQSNSKLDQSTVKFHTLSITLPFKCTQVHKL